MDGAIEVESIPEKGSCFTVELKEGKLRKLPKEKPGFGDQKEEPETKANADIKLLYVEDNPSNLKLVKDILSNINNLEVLSANHAQLGIELAQAHQPNIILMDINLPGMDGVTALRYLKQMDETRNIPVIAVSANAMESDIKAALKEGFESYLTKPIQIEPFLEVINKTINTARDRKEIAKIL